MGVLDCGGGGGDGLCVEVFLGFLVFKFLEDLHYGKSEWCGH